jgi:hypothetical protein
MQLYALDLWAQTSPSLRRASAFEVLAGDSRERFQGFGSRLKYERDRLKAAAKTCEKARILEVNGAFSG